MNELKKAFVASNPGISVNLSSGRSKELAERILAGETCDVFAPSDPAVARDLMAKTVGGKSAATWYITFSANEMVVITASGNPLGIRRMTDLAAPGVRVVRVCGEKDMATFRTIRLINDATAVEGSPDLGQRIIDEAAVNADTIPAAVQAVKDGRADAGVVYLSAAVAAGDAVEIIRFPADINLSKEIRNVVTVPATAKKPAEATGFVAFILSHEGRQILQRTGQPPLVPPPKEGDVPQNL